MKRAVERATWNARPAAVLIAAAWGLACASPGAIDIGGDDGIAGPAPPLSIPCTALSTDVVSYRAQKTRTLSPPTENVVAIAPSESGLWLMKAFWNTGWVTFVDYDPATETLGQPSDMYLIFDRPGTGSAGLEVDSRSFWVSLLGNDNAIVRIDAKTGAFHKLPGLSTGGSSDLAWLGDELLASTVTGHLYAVTPPPSWTKREILYAPDAIREFSVATCGSVIVAAVNYGSLSVLNSSGQTLGLITSDEGDLFATSAMAGPIAFYRDQLVVADTAGLELYALTPRP